MRTMYDAVTAANIPANALVVGGYDDGRYVWSAADWARFPNAVHVHISSVGTNVGHVLDCEPGNPNAVQSVNWILMRRAAGVDPYVYTAEWAPGYRWADVVAACNARGVALPHWWKAPGAAADLGGPQEPLMVQTAYPGPYDVGVAADFLPGIEDAPPPTPDPEPPVEVAVNQRIVSDETRQLLHQIYLVPGPSAGVAGLWYRNEGLGNNQNPSAPTQIQGDLSDTAGIDALLVGARLHVVARNADTSTATVAHFWTDDLTQWGVENI